MAIILFEANKEKEYELAKPYLYQAMSILEECYSSDKRKEYHIKQYKDFAIFLFRQYGDNTFIDYAYRWVSEYYSSDTTNIKAKKWLDEVKKCLSEL